MPTTDHHEPSARWVADRLDVVTEACAIARQCRQNDDDVSDVDDEYDAVRRRALAAAVQVLMQVIVAIEPADGVQH